MNAESVMKKALKKDQRWARFKAIVDNAYVPEFDAHIDEMKKLHTSRSIRLLGMHPPSGKRVAKAATIDQAVRSRCVEMCIGVTTNRNHLAIAMDAIRSHLYATYSTMMADNGCRTQGDRRTMIDTFLSPADTVLQRLDTITEIADMIIKDIDQGGFSLKHVVEAMQIATRREGL